MTVMKEDFLKQGVDFSEFKDVVFNLSSQAKEDRKINGDKVVNATIGSFMNEDGSILTFDTVFNSFDRVSNSDKARYASDIAGNPDFREEIFKWINRKNNIALPHSVVASPGGTGAIYLLFSNCLEKGQTVLLPEIYWGSYRLMANKENLKTDCYGLVKDGKISLEDLMDKSRKIMQAQGRLMVVINDPCHNPTGISLGKEKWKQLITFFNELSTEGPVIVLNDIAYLDFSYDRANVTDYMDCFNEINENVLLVLAASCSKSFTAYGLRLGADIILAKKQETVDHIEAAFKRTARSCWSNVNNGFMHCFVDVMKNHRDEYLKEKEQAVALLKKRSDVFLKEAEECGLPLYPYTEGFFITIPFKDTDLMEKYHKALIANHIYAAKFTCGIRIAICGLPLKKCQGLAGRLMDILQEVTND